MRSGNRAVANASLENGYFEYGDAHGIVERRFRRYRYRARVRINHREVEIRWTRRAQRALATPLTVELQLYFSCVVKKRVLFHHDVGIEAVPVAPGLGIAFRAIASAVCDPVEFAAHFPAGRALHSAAAAAMVPHLVEFDFRRGRWQGDFTYRAGSG